MRRLAPVALLVLLLAGCGGGDSSGGGSTVSASVFRTNAEIVCKATLGQLGTLRNQKLTGPKLAAAVDETLKKLRASQPPASLADPFARFLSTLEDERAALTGGSLDRGRRLRRQANDLARTLELQRCLQPKL